MKVFAAMAMAFALAAGVFGTAKADERTNIVVTAHQGVGLSYSLVKIGKLIEVGPVATVSGQQVRGGIDATLQITPNVGVGAAFFANRNPFQTNHSLSFSNPQLQLSVRI